MEVVALNLGPSHHPGGHTVSELPAALLGHLQLQGLRPQLPHTRLLKGAGGPAFSLGAKLPPPKSTADSSPAPGDYGLPEAIGPLGPAFTLGAKRTEPDPRLTLPNPGPGVHQRLYPAPSGPAFSLGARLRELLGKKKGRQVAAGPDPGQYHQDPGTAGPAFTFAARVGGSGGTAAGGASALGPTDTAPWPAPPSGPAWTLAPKLADAVPAMQPGPGQYTVPGTAAVGILPFGGAAAASSGPRKHVSFSGGTHFRDSTEQRSALQEE
ncbi:uncharacterized protein HaLaN_11136 [Haematococcus lacustris]|uniref:Uncharacterized protein n=1 Tax=Haematococcus lacustris TaxID=44745 RepID=A0A699YZJ8_HAELA|nr:uncharacterized protein HaLaN_11136 [Haematococcus lacustris]